MRMPKDQQFTLSVQISRSVLLSEELKRALRDALSKMTQEDAGILSTLLEGEESVLQSIITHNIHAAAEKNDVNFFKQLSAHLARARKTMRKTEEQSETMTSDERTSHLLD